MTLTAIDKRESQQDRVRFYFEGGLRSYVTFMNREDDVIGDIYYVEKNLDNVQVEISLQYKRSDFGEKLMSFVNNVITPGGGTHITGFRTALTRTINKYARDNNLLGDKDNNLTNDDVVEGITAIVSVKVSEPQFE